MEPDEQLDEWVKGNPVHNDERNECCPDFSCCNGGNIAPREVRERFARAYYEEDRDTQIQMLLMFLGDAFTSLGHDVHIVDDKFTGCLQ